MKIALLEDSYLLREHICRYFRLKKYEIDSFENGEEILEANLKEYDIFILDINVPEIDGFEVAKYFLDVELKTPIVFISSYTSIEYIKKAFELGASDVVKKPFELAELEIRVNHILKPFLQNVKLNNNLNYHIDERILLKNDKEIKLTKVQHKILTLLIKNMNNLVTYDNLRDYIWDDKEINDNTIASHMRDLRKKIEDELIENIKGEGYLLKRYKNERNF